MVEVIRVSNQAQYNWCIELRRRVFIEEQGVPEQLEIDDYDKDAIHFLALSDQRPIGVGRMRLKKSYVKFERIATLKASRGSGVGRTLMEFMQSFAKQEFPQYLPAMHAQQSAVGFYQKLGWVPIGEEFFEAHIPHRVLIFPPRDTRDLQELKVWNDPNSREDIRIYLKTHLRN